MHKPMPPPGRTDLFREVLGSTPAVENIQRLFLNAGGPAPDGKYRHWDILRHLRPPAGFTHKEWWLAIKFARAGLFKGFPLEDAQGNSFRYGLPDVAHEMLHRVDKRGGTIAATDQVTDPQTRDTYLIRSLMEEAITSSQLEGAATTRHVAKEMLRAGRAPTNRNERMIVNNYRAMHLIRERTGVALTPAFVLDLQETLTAGTLRDESAAGRFRIDTDHVVVEDPTGLVLHVPPRATELPQRVATMCDFANGKGHEGFIHPVVKAILLHFWLAYDHPFVDGNGRTARALFYWSMARDGYWLCEFLSISRIIKKAPAKYARAFLYTETDENDATYFLLNQLRVLNRAMDDLYTYLKHKARDLTETRRILERSGPLRGVLNHRQVALVHHALRHPNHPYTIQSHRQSHNVSYQTARTDLLTLAELTLLEQGKSGRSFVFDAPQDLRGRLNKLSRSARRPRRRQS